MRGCLWLWSKIMYRSTTVSTTAMHILNIVSLMCVATSEPAMLPITAGIDSFIPLLTSSRRLRRKASVAVRFCNTTAIRLVPLATFMGSPSTMNSVMVMMAPPPARVLMTPTTIPDSTSINMIVVSFISVMFCRPCDCGSQAGSTRFDKNTKKRANGKIFSPKSVRCN